MGFSTSDSTATNSFQILRSSEDEFAQKLYVVEFPPCLNADADQIIEIPVRKRFDIEEDERSVRWDLQLSDHVYFFLADREGS